MVYFNETMAVKDIIAHLSDIRILGLNILEFFDGMGVAVLGNAAGGAVTEEQIAALRNINGVGSIEQSRVI
jgi:hypothetical protein